MNLIERYVTEVGKYLPRRSRADIEAELRSTLEDMLEDRSQQAHRPVDEAMVTALLEEYGSPKKVAASYGHAQYLIGPRLYPTFMLVLQIVAFAVVLGLTIATAIAFVKTNMTPPEVLKTLGEFALNLLGGLIQAFGNVVLVFAILERVLPPSELEDKETWTPAELIKEPHPDEVKIGEMIAGIVFTMAFLLVFNFYPEIVGIWLTDNGALTQAAGLSEAFFRYLPFINISGLLTIALYIYLLRNRFWTAATRWTHIAIELIGIAIAYSMLQGPSLLKLFPMSTNTELQATLTQIFDRMVPFILLLVIILSGIEIVKTLVRLVRPAKTSLPFQK